MEAFIWQCFFCNNQYRLQEGQQVTDESLGDIFQARLLDIQQMVVMLDKFMQPKYLERVWCVYEMYTAAANSDRVTVDIMLPPDQAADIRTKIASGVWDDIRKKFQEVNVEHAKAREKKDEDMVKEHIKKGAGFDAVNAKVREKMMAWVLKQVEMFLLEDGKVRSGADFLRTAGLADYIDKLEEQGVCTFEDLEDLEDADLAAIGFDPAARERLLQVVKMGPSAREETDFKDKLRMLGLTADVFEGLSEEQVMRNRDMEERLPTLGDKKKFRKWRQSCLTGEAVVEELVALDMLVERGPDWCYDGDSDDDMTPEDGGPQGVGKVVAWCSASGEAYGPSAPRPGWVKVQWQVTGRRRSYRMGTPERHSAELVFAAAIADAQAARALREVPKGEIQLHHLRCNFGYRCGTRFSHYALFDTRVEACEKVAGFKPGDVVEDKDGDRATCVGLKYRADAKKVDMWFHCNGRDGAGLFTHPNHDRCLRKVAHKRLQEVNREDVEGASDGEIDHDEREWVGQNLKPTLKYLSKSGQVLHFDVREEILQHFRMPFKSGDVLVDKADGERMTCIGVASDPMRQLAARHGQRGRRVAGSVAEVWFHVESAGGAGLNPKMYKALSRFKVVENRPVHELGVDSAGDAWDMETALGLLHSLDGALQCDFSFPIGAGKNATPDWFDVRPEIVYNVVGFRPGDVLTIRGGPPGTRLTLIGLRPDPDTGEISVWWHHEDFQTVHAGAGKIPGWEHMRQMMRDTGEKTNLEELKERLRSGKGRSEENQGDLSQQQMEMLSQMSAQLSPADLQQLMGALMR